MDKIHACKHPFFFPRNNFITVVKKIHFCLFKLSYKMSVNPQTPNERTNEQTKFSISPISHSLAGRGNEAGEIVFHSEENSRRTSRPRVSYENGLSRVLFVFPRDKSGTVSSSHSLEREKERGSRAHLSRALNRVRMVARRPRYTIPSRFIIVTISNCWTLLPSLPSSIIVRIGETESASCLYD